MKRGSDIDVLVEFKGEKSLLDLVGLKLELEEALGREVDVVEGSLEADRGNEGCSYSRLF